MKNLKTIFFKSTQMIFVIGLWFVTSSFLPNDPYWRVTYLVQNDTWYTLVMDAYVADDVLCEQCQQLIIPPKSKRVIVYWEGISLLTPAEVFTQMTFSRGSSKASEKYCEFNDKNMPGWSEEISELNVYYTLRLKEIDYEQIIQPKKGLAVKQ